MEKDLPEVESEWSAEGQRLHHAAATQDFTGLTPSQTDLVQEKIHERNRFWESLSLGEAEFHTEYELPYTLPDKTRFFNHADIIAVSPKIVAVVDYKFGYEEVDAPELNQQLAVYVAAAAERWKAGEYYGLIIPRFGKPAPPVCYRSAQIPALRQMIDAAYFACTPDAKRTPGLGQCRYCRGFTLGVCREARAVVAEAALAPVEKNASEVLALMNPEKRTKLFDAFKMAADLRKVYIDAAKPLVERDPDFIPGYGLSKAGEIRTTVTDMLGLRKRLGLHANVTTDEFVSACSISNKDLTELVRSYTDLAGRELKDRVQELTSGLVDTTPVERSLERK